MLLRRAAVGAVVVGNVAVLLATSPPPAPMVYSDPSEPVELTLTSDAPVAQFAVAEVDVLADRLELDFRVENGLPETGVVEVYRSGTPWEAPPGEGVLPYAVVPINGAWGGPAVTEMVVAVFPDRDVTEPPLAPVYVWLALTGDGAEAVGELDVTAVAYQREEGWVPEAPVLE